MRIAADCARAIPLGYMGVDIIWDEQRGPCVIEVNARPGLAIQLANRRGLKPALGAGRKAVRERETAMSTEETEAIATKSEFETYRHG